MARSTRPALLLLFTVLAGVAAVACEDRGPPDDVERTRTGGIGRVPELSASDDFGRGESGARSAGAGGAIGPQGGLDTPVATPGAVPGGGVGAGGVGAGVAGTGSGVDVDGDGTRDGLGASGTGAATSGTGGTATSTDAAGTGDGASGSGDDATDVTGTGTGASGAGGVAPGGTDVGASGLDENGFGGIDTDPANGAPVASFVLSPQCVSEIQSVVTLTSTSSDPDGDALRCVWTIPSGVPDGAGDCTVTVTFFNAAASPVVLTVDDGNGGVHSVTHDVTVCGEP